MKGQEGMPIAQNTELGWLISGNINGMTNRSSLQINTIVSTAEVDELIKKFWEINEVQGVK